MILYHGTSARRAQIICREGFRPKKPSRRVWFAQGRGYAMGRAKTQARRRRDRAVVLVCDVDLDMIRRRVGSHRVVHRGGVVAINAAVPVSVIRSYPGADVPTTATQLAKWINHVLGLKSYKGVGRRHQGVVRLSEWVAKRLADRPRSRLRHKEILYQARQWLPEFFEGVEVDPERLTSYRKVEQIDLEIHEPVEQADEAADEALELLEDPRAGKRVQGLRRLAEAEPDDLFEWCVMFLTDEAQSVRLAALELMLRCEEGDPGVIRPHARSEDKRIRAAALAALARHDDERPDRWLERGLKDPAACVRIRAARALEAFDPAEHRRVFELALYDPNPDVARVARKLTEGKGYGAPRW
jgi:HEAT repeat protein